MVRSLSTFEVRKLRSTKKSDCASGRNYANDCEKTDCIWLHTLTSPMSAHHSHTPAKRARLERGREQEQLAQQEQPRHNLQSTSQSTNSFSTMPSTPTLVHYTSVTSTDSQSTCMKSWRNQTTKVDRLFSGVMQIREVRSFTARAILKQDVDKLQVEQTQRAF